MNEEETIHVRVGAMIRRHLRTMLNSERFSGSSIRWMEDRRWTTSVFSIRGKRDDVNNIGARIEHWLMCIGAKR